MQRFSMPSRFKNGGEEYDLIMYSRGRSGGIGAGLI
jgi:hypothetical protein